MPEDLEIEVKKTFDSLIDSVPEEQQPALLLQLVKEFVEKAKNKPDEFQPKYPERSEVEKEVLTTFFSIPKKRQPEFLALLKKAQHEPEIPLPKDKIEMKKLGIKTYAEFKTESREKTGKESKDSKECLRQNFGTWLKFATPRLNRDYMSQADLRRLDAPLLGQLRKQYSTEELNDFLPSKPLLGKQETNPLTEEDKREVSRLNSLIYRQAEI